MPFSSSTSNHLKKDFICQRQANPHSEPKLEHAKLKKEFLKLLEEDKEFRYTVAGYIGLGEILKKLEEHDRKFNEILAELRAHRQILDRHTAILEEHSRILEEHSRRLEEHDRKFNEIMEILRMHDNRLSRIEMELGALSESFYCKAFWDDFKETLKGNREKVKLRKRNVTLYGEEVDLLIVTDKAVYVVEVKVKPKHSHVGALESKIELARKAYPNLRVEGILAGTQIGNEIEEYAKNKGIRVYRV